MIRWQPLVIAGIEALVLISLIKVNGWPLRSVIVTIVAINLILPLIVVGVVSMFLKGEERQAFLRLVSSTAANDVRAIRRVLTSGSDPQPTGRRPSNGFTHAGTG